MGNKIAKGQPRKLLEGLTIGYLFIEKFLEYRLGVRNIGTCKVPIYLCRCQCGNYIERSGDRLLSNYDLDKNCGCINKKQREEKRTLSSSDITIRQLEGSYKTSARIRNIDYKLTTELFRSLVTTNCYYCGDFPSTVRKAPRNNKYAKDILYNGIDRKDPKIGYIEDNIVTCCKHCNYAKSISTYEEFISKVEKIYKRIESGDIKK